MADKNFKFEQVNASWEVTILQKDFGKETYSIKRLSTESSPNFTSNMKQI